MHQAVGISILGNWVEEVKLAVEAGAAPEGWLLSGLLTTLSRPACLLQTSLIILNSYGPGWITKFA